MRPSTRIDSIELSLIRQINALATPGSINLGLGEPNVEPDEEFRQMARIAASEGSWHYTANAGTLELRQAVAELLGGSLEPTSEVVITAGSEEGLYAIFQAWTGEGDEVLVPDPGFLAYATLARLSGATPVPYALDPEGWSIDFASLESALSPRTKLIVLNSPSNPTGGVVDEPALARIAAIAEERGLLVVSDEVYREIYYDQPPPSMLGRCPGAIVVGGMSKSHAMTGLRLGWLAGDRNVIAPVLKAHQYIATCASAFTQSLALLALRNGEWNRRWLDSVRLQFGAQRAAALRAAREHIHEGIAAPPGAFYLFVPVPSCDTVALAKSLAAEREVLAIPGVAFGARGEGFLRLSFAQSETRLAEGIGRIGEHLRGLEGCAL